MAIEPLGSAMTFQAQTTPQAKPVQKPAVENTEVATSEQAATAARTADLIMEPRNSRQLTSKSGKRLNN